MDRTKKRLLKFFMLPVAFFIIYFFIKRGSGYYPKIFKFMEDYFGIFSFPVLTAVVLDIFFLFLKNPKKRILYKTRLFFGIVFIISLSVGIIFLMGRNSENFNEFNIINDCILKYKFGFMMTYFIIFLYENCRTAYIFTVCGISVFISLFFLIGKEIHAVIKYIEKSRQKRKALKMKEALLRQIETKIQVKEKLMINSIDEIEKQNLYLDQTIREKVEEAMQNNSLPLKISIEKAEVEEKEEKTEEN